MGERYSRAEYWFCQSHYETVTIQIHHRGVLLVSSKPYWWSFWWAALIQVWVNTCSWANYCLEVSREEIRAYTTSTWKTINMELFRCLSNVLLVFSLRVTKLVLQYCWFLMLFGRESTQMLQWMERGRIFVKPGRSEQWVRGSLRRFYRLLWITAITTSLTLDYSWCRFMAGRQPKCADYHRWGSYWSSGSKKEACLAPE